MIIEETLNFLLEKYADQAMETLIILAAPQFYVAYKLIQAGFALYKYYKNEEINRILDRMQQRKDKYLPPDPIRWRSPEQLAGAYEKKLAYVKSRNSLQRALEKQRLKEKPSLSAKSEQLGGVSLDFDYLNQASMEVNFPLFVDIPQPVVVSLEKLLRELKKYAGRERPLHLQYPGAMERIYGYHVVKGKNGSVKDLLLIGGRARDGRGMNVDLLITGIKSVWRNGSVPGCSLDPIPYNTAGPQYTRVLGVPENSLFARIMLDADYEMKRILTFGAEKHGLREYNSQSDIIAALSELEMLPDSLLGRFWFSPVPLTSSNLWRGTDNQTILFNTNMKVLTEQMLLAKNGMINTGTTHPVYLEAARDFNLWLPHLEDLVVSADGRPLFRDLHLVFDITALCLLLRHNQEENPLLAAFTELRERELEGEERVPLYYPGITHHIGETGIVTSGGVDLKMRINNRILARQIKEAPEIELNPGAFTPADWKEEIWTDYEGSLLLVSQLGGKPGIIETHFLEGLRFLSINNYSAAAEIFRQIVDREPEEEDALAYYLLALAGMGKTEKAGELLKKIHHPEKDSLLYTVKAQLSGFTTAEKDSAGLELYLKQAKSCLNLGLYKQAEEHAYAAFKKAPRNTDVLLTLASAYYYSGDYDKAWKIMLRLRKKYRKLLTGEIPDQIKEEFAQVLLQSIYIRFLHFQSSFRPSANANGSEALIKFKEIQNDCTELLTYDPLNEEVYKLEFLVRATRILILSLRDDPGSWRGVKQTLTRYKTHFSGSVDAYGMESLIAWGEGNLQSAKDLAAKALRKDPDNGISSIARGLLYMSQKEWDRAIDSLTRGAQLSPLWKGYAAAYIQFCNLYMKGTN